jgi:hypothetical protein
MLRVLVLIHIECYFGKNRTVKDRLFCKCAQARSKEIGLSVLLCSVVQHVLHATVAAFPFPYFSFKHLYKRGFED